jgi:hypothetical protein
MGTPPGGGQDDQTMAAVKSVRSFPFFPGRGQIGRNTLSAEAGGVRLMSI